MTSKLTAQKFNSKLEELSPRLTAIAKKVSNYGLVDWEDLLQTMCAEIIKHQMVDDSFFAQKDAFILKYGEFVARHEVQKARVYLKYVDEEGCEIDPEDGDENEVYSLDLVIDREKIQQTILNVEREVENSELRDVILEGCDFLSESNIQIVTMLYMGYRQVDIAKELGISKPAVNQRIKTIASTLQGFVQGY
jgi:RNA polymerase sigma factor (sigma-70 family)